MWIVKGIGRREETRVGTKLAAVTVDNLRWLLRWDILHRQVIAWPSKMADPKEHPFEDGPLFDSREKCIAWGEEHKATIQRKKDNVNGREVEKIDLSWPGGAVEPQIIIWFDPKTVRPVENPF